MKPVAHTFILYSTPLSFVIGAALVSSSIWHQLNDLHRKFHAAEGHTLYVAQIQGRFLKMQQVLLRLKVRQDPGDVELFLTESRGLSSLLNSNRFVVTSPQQVNLLVQLRAEIEMYQQVTTAIVNRTRQTDLPFKPIDEQTLKILMLIEQMHQEAPVNLAPDLDRGIRNVVGMVVVWLLLLVLCGIAAVRLMYLIKIAPLEVGAARTKVTTGSFVMLASRLAHELRNPLTAISVRLHGLKKLLAEDSSGQDHLIEISGEIRRLESTLRELLRFAQPLPPQMQLVSAQQLFDAAKTLVEKYFARANIILNFEAPPEVQLRVDTEQILLVLTNLIRNAIESIDGLGSVALCARVSKRRLNGQVRQVMIIEVTDSGRGIAPEIQKLVFQPFFSTKEQGIGLGLATAMRIVQEHGGSMDFQTRVGQGTVFMIFLPILQ